MRVWRLFAVAGVLASLMVVGFTGCNKKGPATTASISGGADSEEQSGVTGTTLRGSAAKAAPKFRLPVVVIETSAGNIKVRLRDDKAPLTVENFLENYVDRGFYEQTIFHHVEKGVMIAAGGYTADLEAKQTRTWIRNESNNGLSNTRGTLAMAHHPDYPHSATSQFFINVADNSSFDFREPQESELSEDSFGYCVFGEIVEGLDVADHIAESAIKSTETFPSVPVEPVVIQSIHYAE